MPLPEDPIDALCKTVAAAARAFEGAEALRGLSTLPGPPAEIVTLALPPKTRLSFFPSPLFPEAPPVTLLEHDGERRFLPLAWPASGVPVERLLSALGAFVASSSAYDLAYGHSPWHPLTRDPTIAARAGWPLLITGAALAPAARDIAAQRVDPDLVAALAGSNVLIVGLGSVGSYIAEQLVRSGVGALGLIDHDTVEDGNLSRTAYTRSHVGMTKAAALSRHLLDIAPDLSLSVLDKTFQSSDRASLRTMFDAATLVIAATDDPTAQAQINSCAQYADRSALHIGLYKGAKGGEIGISVPGLTPCFRCQVGSARIRDDGAQDAHRATDYGTGRLFGEIALGCDIQHVASAALKLAFSLLAALKGLEGPLPAFAMGAIERKLHYLTLGMTPDWWFYPQIFADTPGQYAFQSIWITAEAQAGCPDCDPATEKSDPFDYIASRIDPEALLRRAAASRP